MYSNCHIANRLVVEREKLTPMYLLLVFLPLAGSLQAGLLGRFLGSKGGSYYYDWLRRIVIVLELDSLL